MKTIWIATSLCLLAAPLSSCSSPTCASAGTIFDGKTVPRPSCCEDLVHGTLMVVGEGEDGELACESVSLPGEVVCPPCGDGSCQRAFENVCNCPEDCED